MQYLRGRTENARVRRFVVMTHARKSGVRVVPPLTREERRSLALHAAIAQKLVAYPVETLARATATLSRMREANPGAARILDEWAGILARPVPVILDILADPAEQARELRHATPFAGLLSPRERADVYRRFARSEADVV